MASTARKFVPALWRLALTKPAVLATRLAVREDKIAKQRHVEVSEATLSEATLSEATLSEATLSEATLSEATLSEATLSEDKPRDDKQAKKL
jgi:hypothetical protein